MSGYLGGSPYTTGGVNDLMDNLNTYHDNNKSVFYGMWKIVVAIGIAVCVFAILVIFNWDDKWRKENRLFSILLAGFAMSELLMTFSKQFKSNTKFRTLARFGSIAPIIWAGFIGGLQYNDHI